MLKKIIILIIIFIIGISVFELLYNKNDINNSSENVSIEKDAKSEETKKETQQVGSINSLPPGFIEESNYQGKVEKFEYTSYKYAENNEEVLKPAYIYLPFGYDENDYETKYDIIYLMHGFEETAERILIQHNTYGNYNLQNILDNMIANGDIKPVIVVTPTFDATNQLNTYEKSIEEMNVFYKELINDLIPAVESKYHTYASSTDKEGIKSSREHRAFGGFSMGAATTWSQLIHNLDYIKYFLPMSGDCWEIEPKGGLNKPDETAKLLEDAVKESGYKNNDFLIYAVTGTDDILFDQVNNQMNSMLKLTETFTNENLKYRIKDKGTHGYNCCMEYIYDALPNFFGTK